MGFCCKLNSSYSIYGKPLKSSNIYGVRSFIENNSQCENINITVNDDSFLEIMEYLLSLVNKFEVFIKSMVKSNGFGIVPEASFMDVTIKISYPQVLARRIYYTNGYESLKNGKVDCRILEILYREHPLLQSFDFKTYEPECCSVATSGCKSCS